MASEKPGSALFIVRASVPEADRAAFDDWYERDHLPDAMTTFGAQAAWRAWSVDDPGVHVAVYEFDALAGAQSVPTSPGLTRLIADFEARWADRVPRTREIVQVVQRIVR